MKTIFDKVDPKYVECTTGVCEHNIHNVNILVPVLVSAIILISLTKMYRSLKYEK